MQATRLNRRSFIASGLAAGGTMVLPISATARDSRLPLGEPRAFSFDMVRDLAKELAARPYEAPSIAQADLIQEIDYTRHNQIRYRADMTVWGDDPDGPPVQFFHPGRYFKEPVRVSIVKDAMARDVAYTPDAFEMPEGHPALGLSDETGFAGFRVMNPNQEGDWLAYLGASYFRTAGPEGQFGLSARGIAIDAAVDGPEEFPRFTHFWLEQAGGGAINVHALLDGPSVTGAYRFACVKGEGGIVQDVEATLFLRRAVKRLGIAPLTSMFWYGETNRHLARDWRPQIHDSDGLLMWTGAGERIWRPLINPPRVSVNAFLDNAPRGFGLMQRDRDFENYQDDAVFYEKRASLWVEPLGDWGAGAVELLEIPTDDEIHDNIGAFWVPAEAGGEGTRHDLAYRLHWLADEPYPENIARIIATRMGAGGLPGQPRPEGVVKYAIDFEGGELNSIERENIELVLDAGNGTASQESVYPIVGTKRWRAIFDLAPDGELPVDLRLRLIDTTNGRALSEGWVYQHYPEHSI
jgi:periplasmic glucans biosynthesis protein